MLKLKSKILPLLIVFSLAAFTAFLPLALAQEAGKVIDVIGNLDDVAGKAKITQITPAGGGQDVYEIYGKFINLFLGFIGAIFLLITIYAGFTWMMAKGNEAEVEKATKLIENSAIGIFIIIGSYFLINYVVFKLIEIFSKPIA